MNARFTKYTALAATLAVLGTGAVAQTMTVPGASSDVGNWGQLPFSAVPNVALSQNALRKMRALEDSQLLARRAVEDRFATEMRDLLAAQAADRAALMSEPATGQ